MCASGIVRVGRTADCSVGNLPCLDARPVWLLHILPADGCALARHTPYATRTTGAAAAWLAAPIGRTRRKEAGQHPHIRSGRRGVETSHQLLHTVGGYVSSVRSDAFSPQASPGRPPGKPRPSKYITSSIGAPCASFFDRYLPDKLYLSKCINSALGSSHFVPGLPSHRLSLHPFSCRLLVPVVRQSPCLNADFAG